MRDVLDWSAAETADLLDTSVASVTSALQRARATLKQHRPDEPGGWAPVIEPLLMRLREVFVMGALMVMRPPLPELSAASTNVPWALPALLTSN